MTTLSTKLENVQTKAMNTVAENLMRHSNGTYYVNAKINGNLFRKSLRTKVLKIAKLERDKELLKARAQAGKLVEDSRKTTFTELIEIGRSHYQSKDYKSKSLQYQFEMLDTLTSCLPNRAVSTLSESETVAIFKELAAHYSAQRYNNILGTFRELMKIAKKNQIRFDDPSANIERLRIKKNSLVMPTREEFRTAVESIRKQKLKFSEESANYVEFLAYSGLRCPGESSNVYGRDILKDQIRVTGGETGTKNHEIRYIPINSALRNLLERIEIYEDQRLFSIKTPYRALAAAYKRLGIKQSSKIHGLRHFFATTCLESGIDFATVGKWIGHKDGGMLTARTYGHIRDEHSQKQAAKVVF